MYCDGRTAIAVFSARVHTELTREAYCLGIELTSKSSIDGLLLELSGELIDCLY